MRQHRASSRQRFRRFLTARARPRLDAAPTPQALGGSAPSGAPARGALQASLTRPIAQLRSPNFRRYLAWVRPHAGALGKIFVLSLLAIGMDMVWPLVSAYLIDRVILNASLSVADKLALILKISAGMLALFAVSSGVGWLRSTWLQLLSSRLSFRLRSQLFQRVLRLSLGELSEMTTGGILSRLSTDVDNTSGLLQQALISPLLAGLRLIVTLGIVFSLNAQIAGAVILALPPVLLLQMLHARRLRPIWRSLSEDRQAIDGRVGEGLGGVRVVRSFRREKLEELAYTVGHHTVIRKQLLATQVQRTVATIWELILPMAQLMILALGGYLVIMGRTSLGVLVAFQAYIWRVFDPILQIASSISGTQRGLAAMDRVFELLDKPEERPDVPGALPAPRK